MIDKRPAAGRPRKAVFTASRRIILNAIRLYMATHGRMPTFRYLIETYGLHRVAVYRGVWALADLGYIQLQPIGTIPAVLLDKVEPLEDEAGPAPLARVA